jgi:chloride channel 3/4/5
MASTIKAYMSPQWNINFNNSLIFLIVWFIFTTLTSGTVCPGGIFMASMLIGCALGEMYTPLHNMIFHPGGHGEIQASLFAILGATAVLSGATRMSLGLAVVILETTANFELFLPIIFTLFVSFGAGNLLVSKSTYLAAVRSKNIPILMKKGPTESKNVTASQVMQSRVVSMNFIVKVQEAYDKIKNNTYNGFPVVNGRGGAIGIIERDVLITIIENEAWYNRDELLGRSFNNDRN